MPSPGQILCCILQIPTYVSPPQGSPLRFLLHPSYLLSLAGMGLRIDTVSSRALSGDQDTDQACLFDGGTPAPSRVPGTLWVLLQGSLGTCLHSEWTRGSIMGHSGWALGSWGDIVGFFDPVLRAPGFFPSHKPPSRPSFLGGSSEKEHCVTRCSSVRAGLAFGV